LTKYTLYFIIYICYNLQVHMNKYLPSKKFVFTLISIVLASGIIYTSILYKESKKTNIIPIESTEPNLDDTDILPPVATTTTAEIIDPIKTQADFDKLTVTEKMSREILIQYTNNAKTGFLLTDNEIQNIVNRALAYIPKMTFKIYSEKDIITTNNLDYNTLRNYTNTIAKILLDNINTSTETVDSIIADIDTSDEIKTDEEIRVIFQRFTPLINKNRQTVSDLLKVTVPTVFVPEHLKLTNSVEEIYEKLTLMQKSYNDMAVLVNVKGSYSTSTENLSTALIEMSHKLSVAKVTFSSTNDYGYQLFNVIMASN
jgi:hypothetical protein